MTLYPHTANGTTYLVSIPERDTAVCGRCQRERSTLLLVLMPNEGWTCQPDCR